MGESSALHLNVLLSTLTIAAMFLFAPSLPHLCLMRTYLHIPCPGCGITTAMRALLHGQLREAIHANPASLILAAGLCWQLLTRTAALAGLPTLTRDIYLRSRQLSHLTYGALAAVWIIRLT